MIFILVAWNDRLYNQIDMCMATFRGMVGIRSNALSGAQSVQSVNAIASRRRGEMAARTSKTDVSVLVMCFTIAAKEIELHAGTPTAFCNFKRM